MEQARGRRGEGVHARGRDLRRGRLLLWQSVEWHKEPGTNSSKRVDPGLAVKSPSTCSTG